VFCSHCCFSWTPHSFAISPDVDVAQSIQWLRYGLKDRPILRLSVGQHFFPLPKLPRLTQRPTEPFIHLVPGAFPWAKAAVTWNWPHINI
jgi:hypothetical protein